MHLYIVILSSIGINDKLFQNGEETLEGTHLLRTGQHTYKKNLND